MRGNFEIPRQLFRIDQRPRVRNRIKWFLRVSIIISLLIGLGFLSIEGYRQSRSGDLGRIARLVAEQVELQTRNLVKNFIIKNVLIEGNDRLLTSSEVSWLQDLRGSNLLTFQLQPIQKTLLQNYLIQNAMVQKQYPDTLKIQLSRKKLFAMAILDRNFGRCLNAKSTQGTHTPISSIANKTYVLDAEGGIFPYAAVSNEIEMSTDLPLIRGSKNGNLKGDEVCKHFFHLVDSGRDLLETLADESGLRTEEISEVYWDDTRRIWEVYLSRAHLTFTVSEDQLRANVQRLSRVLEDLKEKQIEPTLIQMQFKDQIVVVPKTVKNSNAVQAARQKG